MVYQLSLHGEREHILLVLWKEANKYRFYEKVKRGIYRTHRNLNPQRPFNKPEIELDKITHNVSKAHIFCETSI